MARRFASIGEAMVELSGGAGDLYRLGFAGDTLNTAYYVRAGLGKDWAVDYVTAVGDDAYSDRLVAHIAAQGIGTGAIRVIPGKRPGLYIIHQADGDRHFTYWRETAAARMLADDIAALAAALDDVEIVYFSGITLAILAPGPRADLLALLGEKRRAWARICFDPNIRPILWPDPETLAQALTAAGGVSSLVMPTHADEAPVFGDRDDKETALRYLEAGAEEVVVKNGPDPALVATHQDSAHVAAKRVATVVDATGAGDSFNGAYIAARLVGKTPEEAAAEGHRIAALVIGHHGALVERSLLG